MEEKANILLKCYKYTLKNTPTNTITYQRTLGSIEALEELLEECEAELDTEEELSYCCDAETTNGLCSNCYEHI